MIWSYSLEAATSVNHRRDITMSQRLVSLFLVAALLVAVPSSGPAQDVGGSIRRLDSAWARAYATHDTSLALALYADDLIVTGSNGSVRGRSGEMADIRPQPGLQMSFFRTTDVAVRAHPGVAVVAGVAEWQFTLNGQVTTLRRRYTSVFVAGGPLGWRIVALHMGRAPGPAPAGDRQ